MPIRLACQKGPLIVLVLLGLSLSGEGALSNEPLFRLGDKTYDFVSTLGVNKKELRSTFNAEVQKLSEAQLRELLRRRTETRAAKDEDGVDGASRSRAELEHRLWKFALKDAAHYALTRLIMASITERIVATHRIALADYFNVDAIRDGIKRQIRLGEFFYACKDLPEDQSEKLYAEARSKYKAASSKEAFDDVRRRTKAEPFYGRWYLEAAKALEAGQSHLICRKRPQGS